MYLEAKNYNSLMGAPSWPAQHFTPREMRCRKTDAVRVWIPTLMKLDRLRARLGERITVISGYRSPEHNAEVSESGSLNGPHTWGRAFDILPYSRERSIAAAMQIAKEEGFTRCGLLLSKERLILHLDDLGAAEGFADRRDGQLFCWTYRHDPD